jgi:3-mercaptopyruvate sulfurtransferase SseA
VVRELRKAGWPNARALIGGWAALKDSGLPIEEDAQKTSDDPLVTLKGPGKNDS